MQLKLCWIWLQQVRVSLLMTVSREKTLTRKNFLKLSAGEKDQYIRYINTSGHYISHYVENLTPYSEEVNKTVKSRLSPTATRQHSFTTSATITCSCECTTMLHETPTWHDKGRYWVCAWRAGVSYVASTVHVGLGKKTLQEVSNDEKLCCSLLGLDRK